MTMITKPVSQTEFAARSVNIDTRDAPRHWMGGDVFKTRFFDALSALFPDGERFFIETARAFRDDVSDPLLKKQLKEFIRQEGQHGKEHTQFNDRLRAQGVDIDAINDRGKRILGFYLKHLNPKSALALTVMFEHMTAIMGHTFMANQALFDQADPKVRALFQWHAVEEIEHKAVCYDIYQTTAQGGYLRRVLVGLWATFDFQLVILLIMTRMLKQDGQNNLSTWRKGLSWLYGKKGILRPMIPLYFAYYRRDFHPDQLAPPMQWQQWLDVYKRGEGALAASEAVWRNANPA
ncbi:MAG: metal-dependent hydrolase [Hahellaceae bacterium]|nr:metal-dependent hydrolase [Hahellaceae bacterium]